MSGKSGFSDEKFVLLHIDFFMEKLLYYMWEQRLLGHVPALTTRGEAIEVIDPGRRNPNAGPDFFNAKVRIGDRLWAGNVEMHLRDFVLRPLREIAPHKRHPVFQKTITQLAEALEDRTQ